MAYTNSSLVVYKKISPNRTSPRNHAIDRITIHHMAWVKATVEKCGESFAKSSREASSNYGIGYDGRIGLYVPESDRSWCSSNAANDHRAVTIEVANSAGAPDWKVSTKSFNALLDLCEDICRRNGKDTLIWFGDKDKTLAYKPKANEMVMTVHRWFSATECPAAYLLGKHAEIAKTVTARLQKTVKETVKESTKTVQAPAETADNESVIWDFFKGKGLNDFAIAGLMGNLKAESNLRPDNLQNTYERKLDLSDTEYTKAVDDGSYKNFVKDSAGYGLAQWTFWSRKQNLLDFAKERGASIGDLQMQLEFLWKELQGYKTVMQALKSAKSVSVASNAVLTGYEKPADQGSSAKAKRTAFGQEIYNRHKSEPAVVVKTSVVQAGAFKVLKNAQARQKVVQRAGVGAVIAQQGNLYKVQVTCKSTEAQKVIAKLKSAGVDAVLV